MSCPINDVVKTTFLIIVADEHVWIELEHQECKEEEQIVLVSHQYCFFQMH